GFGCEGAVLSGRERAFFADSDPWGFILFARNIETPDQVRRLIGDLRDSVGREAPVLIDQEGGRVARLRPPHWRDWEPPLDLCQRLPDRAARARALHLRYRVIAAELRALGIDVNCAPVADMVRSGTHGVLRNRCYGTEPEEVSQLAQAVAGALLAGGVLPVMKHMPGHGLATVDSHHALPVVHDGAKALEQSDFSVFRALADLPLAMTAHVVFSALDPRNPATLSPRLVALMRGELGFSGLLLTDDLSMQALSGTPAERAERALAAGCDVVLHCNGDGGEMQAVAAACPRLAGLARHRADAALALRTVPETANMAELLRQYDDLMQERLGA
ncbi:MAG: beta-N-acetylhexosaminidase, partial [Paracoccaceae bacterium]